MKLLNDHRVLVVHKSALVPASSMTSAAFELGGRLKLGIGGIKLPPMMDSVTALILERTNPLFVDAWRGADAEECGLVRHWSLPALDDRDLVDFCIQSWETLARIVQSAHEFAGTPFDATELHCRELLDSYKILRESDLFEEVPKAWDGVATELLEPANDQLHLMDTPFTTAKALHVLSKCDSARGWVGSPGRFWPHHGTMIVQRINRRVIREHNAVFFNWDQASIFRLPRHRGAHSGSLQRARRRAKSAWDE